MCISTRLYLLSILSIICLMTPGCDAERFSLRVENVFYIKTIDRVIVTGTVSSGTVKPGDRLTVRRGGTAIAVTVERLEHPQLKLESASKGQPVGLVLLGIRKDQVTAGDVLETP
jgi:selenocysteine-specific elongation factor